MNNRDANHENLIREMLDNDIVKFGNFTLKNGRQSVAYVNLRDMISIPSLFRQATSAYADTLGKSGLMNKPDGSMRFLAGIPEAVVYYAGAVAEKINAPLLQRRVKAKEHGQPRAVEGRFKRGDEVVLLDDVITTASSKLEEVSALGEFGLRVTGVTVLVDRQQGGSKELKAHDLDFATVLTLGEIASYAYENNLANMTQTLYDDLLGELNT
ncbi:hypothetical protein DYH10_00080 [Candidatus Saccharibacteria bacterium CPR2]|nr:hypothetical protein [Candidatus Saccharibacteria bacterium CPR2]